MHGTRGEGGGGIELDQFLVWLVGLQLTYAMSESVGIRVSTVLQQQWQTILHIYARLTRSQDSYMREPNW